MISWIFKNLETLAVFNGFLKVWEVRYGPKIQGDSVKMAMLAPRWAVLGDFGAILRHASGKMATKSARMSQHRRQGANPRGFEGSAGAQDGREHLDLYRYGAPGPGGVARNP